jgi:hypothetical protein
MSTGLERSHDSFSEMNGIGSVGGKFGIVILKPNENRGNPNEKPHTLAFGEGGKSRLAEAEALASPDPAPTPALAALVAAPAAAPATP